MGDPLAGATSVESGFARHRSKMPRPPTVSTVVFDLHEGEAVTRWSFLSGRDGRRLTIWVAGVSALVVVAVVAIMAQRRDPAESDYRSHPITAFQEAPGDSLYSVGVHCFDQARVTAEENDDRVVVLLEVGGPALGECTISEALTLDSPLLDRIVVDASTGDEIEVGG